MDVPSGSPPPGDNLPYFHTAVGTDSGPPVLQHISGDLSDPRSIDMFGLESALGEDLDVDALQTKLPTSDTVAAHEALKWETQRVWLGTQLGWTSVRWTVGRNRLFACVGSSEIDGKPQSTRLEPLILQLISAKNDDLDDNGSSSALTGKPFSKTSSLTPVPKYTFVDRARDQVFKSSTWEAGIKDERMSQGVSDIRNLLVQRPDVGEACGRTTGNKWILGKAQPFVADSRHDAADRSEVYVVVDRKEASLVDADYDLRWFTKTHTSALPST